MTFALHQHFLQLAKLTDPGTIQAHQIGKRLEAYAVEAEGLANSADQANDPRLAKDWRQLAISHREQISRLAGSYLR